MRGLGWLRSMRSDGSEGCLKIVGQRRFELHPLTRHRMVKAETKCVQCLSGKQDFLLFRRKVLHEIRHLQRAVAFIQAVCDDRVPQVMHVNSQLVRPSRLRAQAQKRKSSMAF